MLTKILTSASAITLAGVSLSNNIDFASQYSQNMIALAIAFDTIKLTAPAQMAKATQDKQPLKWLSLAALWTIGGTLSFVAAFGAISSTKASNEANQQAINNNRPIPLILADLRKLQKIPGLACQAPKTSRKYGRKSKRYCPQIETLKTELKTSQQHKGTHKETSSTSQAKLIQAAIITYKPTITTNQIKDAINIGLVLAIELGSLLAGFAFIGKPKQTDTTLTPKQLNQLIKAANQTK